jgi:hypothetical protein
MLQTISNKRERSVMIDIDKLLSDIEKAGNHKLDKCLFKYLTHICEIAGISSTKKINSIDSAFKALLSSQNTLRQKKIIAIYLMMLMCVNSDILWDNYPIRIKTFNVLDSALNKIYNKLNIDITNDNHVKLQRLKCFEREIIRDFESYIGSLTNLNSVIKSRQNYLKLLSKEPTRSFLDVLIDQSLLNAQTLNNFLMM